MIKNIWKNGQKVGEYDDGQEDPKCRCGTELKYYSATAYLTGYCPSCHDWVRHV